MGLTASWAGNPGPSGWWSKFLTFRTFCLNITADMLVGLSVGTKPYKVNVISVLVVMTVGL